MEQRGSSRPEESPCEGDGESLEIEGTCEAATLAEKEVA